MCGLYGMIGDVGSEEKRIALMRALCVKNSERGTHSAGLAVSTGNLKTLIFKRAIHPNGFAATKKFEKFLSGDIRAVIGHTRWATMGGINNANSHPFQIGKTVGAHNGVVRNVRGIERYCQDKGFPAKYDVDSQYLLHLIEHFGHLGPATGSTNLAYFNGGKDSADMRLLRNGSQISYGVVKRSKNAHAAVVFSSDLKHLQEAMLICGVRAKYFTINDEFCMKLYLSQDGVRYDFESIKTASKEEIEEYTKYSDLWTSGTTVYPTGTKTSGSWHADGGYGTYDRDYYRPPYKGEYSRTVISGPQPSNIVGKSLVVSPDKSSEFVVAARRKEIMKRYRDEYGIEEARMEELIEGKDWDQMTKEEQKAVEDFWTNDAIFTENDFSD